jgi:hypothetical protein
MAAREGERMGIDQPLRRRIGAAALVLTALIHPASAQSPAAHPASNGQFLGQSRQYPLLPRELETELALNAAPAHLREGASVLVLGSTGYVTAKQGASAFTCLVSRRGGDLFPVCWDAEGTRALLPIDVDDAKLRLQGKSGAEIDQTIAAGFAAGDYHAPSRAGLAYMLSPLRYRIDARGQITRSSPNPHVMFYGPNLTDADIGGLRGSVAFMNKVGPDGMIIVPLGQTERETILAESQSLIERLERAIGYGSPQP